MRFENKIVNGNYDVLPIDESRYTDPYKDYDFDGDGYPGEYVYGEGEWCDPDYYDELWKRVDGYPGYWVSNYGRVYSEHRRGFIHGTPGKNGHIDLTLHVNKERKHAYLHRLVADAFLNNPKNYPTVRHMDNSPDNNMAWNLRWGTDYDNVHDCIDSGRFRYFKKEDIEKANAVRRTPIVAVELKTGREIEYISQQEACRDLGITQGAINRVLRGLSKHASGYYFYFVNNPKPIDVSSYRYSRKFAKIRAINVETGESYIFNGQTEAAKSLGLSIASISNILSGKTHRAKGYTFGYVDEEE